LRLRQRRIDALDQAGSFTMAHRAHSSGARRLAGTPRAGSAWGCDQASRRLRPTLGLSHVTYGTWRPRREANSRGPTREPRAREGRRLC
jgi:hypothetical protein